MSRSDFDDRLDRAFGFPIDKADANLATAAVSAADPVILTEALRFVFDEAEGYAGRLDNSDYAWLFGVAFSIGWAVCLAKQRQESAI